MTKDEARRELVQRVRSIGFTVELVDGRRQVVEFHQQSKLLELFAEQDELGNFLCHLAMHAIKEQLR